MHAGNHDLINWEDLTLDHMTQYFWGSFATYMDKYTGNKTKVEFYDGNSSASKKSAETRKEKKRQLLFSRIHPESVQVQTQIFFWKRFGHQKSIRNKANNLKTKVSFQLSNDSLS